MKYRTYLKGLAPGVIFFARLFAGFFDGSALLGLFGLWGFYNWGSRKLRGDTGPGPAGAGLKFFCVFSLAAATFALGMLLETAKELFRLRMGLEVKLPGALSLIVIIVTTVLWEGGYGSVRQEAGGRRAAVADLCMALGIFLILAALFSWGSPYEYGESAGALALSLAILGTSVSRLLSAGTFILYERRNSSEGSSAGTSSAET